MALHEYRPLQSSAMDGRARRSAEIIGSGSQSFAIVGNEINRNIYSGFVCVA
jgi:hypothetical protein